MKPFFTHEDFQTTHEGRYLDPYQAAIKANKLLQERGTEVFGRYDDSLMGGGWQDFSTNKMVTKTHKAILICIEKKECRHEPVELSPKADALGSYKPFAPFCKHCGVELVFEWKMA